MIEQMIDLLALIGQRLAHSVEIEFLRYFIAAAGVTLLYALLHRRIAHRRIQSRVPTFADHRREFGRSMQTIGVFAFVGLTTFTMVQTGVIAVERQVDNFAILAIQVLTMVALHDTWFYWMHRSLHHKLLFRRAHATHHVSRTPTSWAAYSFAPLEAVAESIYVPLMLLGLSLVTPLYSFAIFLFMGHQIARNVIGHSGFEFAWPGFTRSRWTGWLTTTTHHDLHHSEGRYNFGLYFSAWDRWMGTEHPRYHERFEAVANRRAALNDATPPLDASVADARIS